MMGWLVFLAILLGYFWMVRREAIGFAQREVEDFIRRYEILYRDDPSRLDRERRETLMMGYFYGLFWPIGLYVYDADDGRVVDAVECHRIRAALQSGTP